MRKLLLKVRLFFATLFGNVDKFLTENVDEAISVVDAIKSIVQSPIVQTVVKITPTNVDDKALDAVNKYLDIAIQKIGIAKECQVLTTQQERLTCYLKKLAEMTPAMQQAVYLKTASLYADAKATLGGIKSIGKAVTSDIDTLVQLRYKGIKV